MVGEKIGYTIESRLIDFSESATLILGKIGVLTSTPNQINNYYSQRREELSQKYFKE